MKLGGHYKIVVDVDGTILTYTAKLNSDDGIFVNFTDKFGKIWDYKKDICISFEEIKWNHK